MDDIFIILLLILLNGVFSMAEIALVSARKSRLSADAKDGSRGAKTALKLADDPDRFLSTVQIGITLIGILTGIFSGAALADEVGQWLHSAGLAPGVARMVGQVSIVVIVTYLSIVIGELVPKRIGLSAANTVAKLVARPMYLLSVVAMPAVWLLSKSTGVLTRLLGLHRQSNPVTEDEIKSIINDGAEAGEVRRIEQDIMERALVLGDLKVSAIMTPKSEVGALTLDMDSAAVRECLSADLHNSYPVYCDSSRKSVCGVVSLKDLILTLGNPGFSLRNVVHEPVYFPESMSVYDALEKMKCSAVHFALVCDEFGDLAGVFTPADILDGLVGELPDDAVSSPVVALPSGKAWLVDASMPFYDFLRYFNLSDRFRPSSYSSVGGFLLDELKSVPARGQSYCWENLCFRVAEIDGAKIRKILVTEQQSPSR